MDASDAIATLRQHEADLKKMGVTSMYLFGSTARGEARPDSDIDLFIDYDPDTFGLMELVGVIRSASDMLGCKADVMTRDSIDPYVRPRAEAEALRVF